MTQDKNDPSACQSEGLDRQVDRLEDKRASKEDARAAGDLRGQRARSSAEKLLTRTTSGAVYAILTLVCIFCGRQFRCRV